MDKNNERNEIGSRSPVFFSYCFAAVQTHLMTRKGLTILVGHNLFYRFDVRILDMFFFIIPRSPSSTKINVTKVQCLSCSHKQRAKFGFVKQGLVWKSSVGSSSILCLELCRRWFQDEAKLNISFDNFLRFMQIGISVFWCWI